MHGYLRLTKTSQFEAVRHARRSWSDRFLVLMIRPNRLQMSRVGFSVGKRIGNAVVRNKTKRRLREAVRQTPVENGWDLVIIARKDAASADFHRLAHSVRSLLGRAKIVVGPSREAPSDQG